MPGVDDVDYLTNSSMMDVDFLPDHLLIIGGSYIGLELTRASQGAQMATDAQVIDVAPIPAGNEAVVEALESENDSQ